MTERVIGPTGSRRRKRLALFVPFMVLAALIMAIAAAAGPIGTAAGFQGDDGNLADEGAGIDWNSFDPVSWGGAAAPYRTGTTSAQPAWKFLGLEDDAVSTADTGFAGGTKQDDNCANVIGAKAPNKDDLKRAYVASKIDPATGKVYLALSWVRIPQNTTSASAHIGFEFNKNTSGSCNETGGLVNRTLGDLLFVYDFEGSATDNPTITVRRWVTSGSCEISQNSPPCWGPAQNLTAFGFAEAKVNTFGSVSDTIAPADESLGTNEFGEALIDMSGAGIFPTGQCNSFGKVFAVSRSSGNSGTAQMKDLVGPGDFNLTNCGTIIIKKRTSPRGIDQNFGFTSNIAGAQLSCSPDTSPASFTLNDKNGATGDSTAVGGNTETCQNVPAGSYTVTEGPNPAGFAFGGLVCEASAGSSGAPDGTVAKQANITLIGGGTVTCVYTNNQQLGAIKVTKTRKFASATSGDPLSQPHSGVNFTVNGVTKATDANGVACFDGLALTSHNVTETVPSGYAADGATTKSVTVDNGAQCSDTPYVGETVLFGNTPLTDLSIDVDADDPGATKSTVSCVDSSGDPAGTAISTAVDPANFDANDLLPDTYTCTILIDP
jgi:hypothetical protein